MNGRMVQTGLIPISCGAHKSQCAIDGVQTDTAALTLTGSYKTNVRRTSADGVDDKEQGAVLRSVERRVDRVGRRRFVDAT